LLKTRLATHRTLARRHHAVRVETIGPAARFRHSVSDAAGCGRSWRTDAAYVTVAQHGQAKELHAATDLRKPQQADWLTTPTCAGHGVRGSNVSAPARITGRASPKKAVGQFTPKLYRGGG